MVKVVDGGDVVVVGLEGHVRVDAGERLGRGRDLGEARLVRLKEEAIHICQFHLEKEVAELFLGKFIFSKQSHFQRRDKSEIFFGCRTEMCLSEGIQPSASSSS